MLNVFGVVGWGIRSQSSVLLALVRVRGGKMGPKFVLPEKVRLPSGSSKVAGLDWMKYEWPNRGFANTLTSRFMVALTPFTVNVWLTNP